jgi:hypothetical protein
VAREGLTQRLNAHLCPMLIELDCPLGVERFDAVEDELRARARLDGDGCCGYFPALRSLPGIHNDLPACRRFAAHLPLLRHAGVAYRFNFLRLSLVAQSVDPIYHLDTDAASALGGDVTTLRRRRVMRLLLNLSSESERTLRYLDVDPFSVDLASEGSYVCVADPAPLHGYARSAVIPPRRGTSVAGLVFVSNLVLHSGVDDTGGHFVAAYGVETSASFEGVVATA